MLYAPYPPDMDAVRAIVKAVAPKPVNIVVGTMSGTLPFAEVQKAGVKRVSMGVALYTRVMGDLRKAAAQLAQGDLASASDGIDFREVIQLISGSSTHNTRSQQHGAINCGCEDQGDADEGKEDPDYDHDGKQTSNCIGSRRTRGNAQ